MYHTLESDALIETVISETPVLFHEHLNSLLRGGSLKPGTIQNRIDSMQLMIDWFRANCQTNLYHLYSQTIDRLKDLRNHFSRINKKRSFDNTIEALVKKRQWVEDGVPGLHRMMTDSWTYFDAIVSLACVQKEITRARYSWALSYVLASLWCLTINSRTKSIEGLTMKGLQNIRKEKFHLSTSFKTSQTYHYQVSVVLNITFHPFST